MTRLRDLPDELSALVARTSGDLGIPEAFVAPQVAFRPSLISI